MTKKIIFSFFFLVTTFCVFGQVQGTYDEGPFFSNIYAFTIDGHDLLDSVDKKIVVEQNSVGDIEISLFHNSELISNIKLYDIYDNHNSKSYFYVDGIINKKRISTTGTGLFSIDDDSYIKIYMIVELDNEFKFIKIEIGNID